MIDMIDVMKHFWKAEGFTLNSVGQRPTLEYTLNPKAVGLTSFWISPLQGFEFFLYRFVGRCPTLLSVALSGLRLDCFVVTFPFAEGFDATINDTNVVNVVNDVVNKILGVFKSNPRATIKDVAKIAGVTPRTIDREVESLKVGGRLKRIGSTRSGHWEVCE